MPQAAVPGVAAASGCRTPQANLEAEDLEALESKKGKTRADIAVLSTLISSLDGTEDVKLARVCIARRENPCGHCGAQHLTLPVLGKRLFRGASGG